MIIKNWIKVNPPLVIPVRKGYQSDGYLSIYTNGPLEEKNVKEMHKRLYRRLSQNV